MIFNLTSARFTRIVPCCPVSRFSNASETKNETRLSSSSRSKTRLYQIWKPLGFGKDDFGDQFSVFLNFDDVKGLFDYIKMKI